MMLGHRHTPPHGRIDGAWFAGRVTWGWEAPGVGSRRVRFESTTNTVLLLSPNSRGNSFQKKTRNVSCVLEPVDPIQTDTASLECEMH